MAEYVRFLKIWEIIRILNQSGIFNYGYATDNGNGAIVEFENRQQAEQYKTIFLV